MRVCRHPPACALIELTFLRAAQDLAAEWARLQSLSDDTHALAMQENWWATVEANCTSPAATDSHTSNRSHRACASPTTRPVRNTRKRRRPQSPRSIVTTTTTSTTTTVTASPVVLEAAAAAAQAAANVAAPAPTASTTVKTVRTKRRLYYGTRPRARAEGRGQQGAE